MKLKKLLKRYGYCGNYPLNSSICYFVRRLCDENIISIKDYDFFVDLLHFIDNLGFLMYSNSFREYSPNFKLFLHHLGGSYERKNSKKFI